VRHETQDCRPKDAAFFAAATYSAAHLAALSEAQRRIIEKEAEKKSKIASPVRRKGRTPKLRSLLLPAHPLKSNDLLLLGS